MIPLAQKIYQSLSGSGSTGGSIVLALSGVELALWDLHGKITGLPLWQLLGGKYRDRVRIYADTGRPGDGGHITRPDRPGIGVELNEELLRAHLAEGETWWD